jgi:hypothetical protein
VRFGASCIENGAFRCTSTGISPKSEHWSRAHKTLAGSDPAHLARVAELGSDDPAGLCPNCLIHGAFDNDPAKALEMTQTAAPYDFGAPGTKYGSGSFFGALYPIYFAWSRLFPDGPPSRGSG